MADESATPGVFARQPAALQDRDGRLDPFDWYRERRTTEPVAYDDDRLTWDVFRYEDVTAVLGDHERFSSATPPEEQASTPMGPNPLSQTMITVDPPEHERLRGFVDERFRPGTIRELRPSVEALADALLDDLPGDRFDFVDGYAFPLPVTVIAELLDVPAERRDEFKAWSDALVAAPEVQTEDALRENELERMQSMVDMGLFFRDVLEARRGGDGDDLVTLAANAEDLSPTEQLGFTIILLIAGNITTTNLLTNAVWTFAEQGLLDDVAAGDVALDGAVEEVLRYRSPVQAMSRVATEDVELGGRAIAAGERVTAWIGSANRDEAMFDEPDAFRPDRRPNRHIAFGTGVHYCLGAPLARLEADVALTAFLDRYDGVTLADEPLEPVASPIVYGLASLPLRVE